MTHGQSRVVCAIRQRRTVVRVEALAGAVVGDDEVILNVVHLRLVARRAVLGGREVGCSVPAVHCTMVAGLAALIKNEIRSDVGAPSKSEQQLQFQGPGLGV